MTLRIQRHFELMTVPMTITVAITQSLAAKSGDDIL